MTPQRRHQAQWEQLFEEKRLEFLNNDCRRALQIESFDELQTGLQELASSYQTNGFPDLLSRLNPTLQHIQSFNSAITSASQANPKACLVWGATQALMQVASTNHGVAENMLEMVTTFNEALPELEAESDLFQDSSDLQSQLQDLYDDYMDYCIESIQYVKQNPTLNYIRSFFFSGPHQSLTKAKTNIVHRSRKILKTAQQVRIKTDSNRQLMEIQQQIQSTLQIEPLSKIPADFQGEGNHVDFPISTVPYNRNYTFLGRDDLLGDISQHLGDNGNLDVSSESSSSTVAKAHDPKCCIVHGLGGIGKTQTALQYTFGKNTEKYDAIFWLQAESEQSLSSTFARIADALQMVDDLGAHDGQNQGRAIKRAEQWLRTTSRSWLMVFDNCEDINDLNPYYPRQIKGRGSIIITTQRPDFFPLTDPADTLALRVKDLDRDKGAELVFKYLRREPQDEEELDYARGISDLVDGLPLALATIGGYMHSVGTSISTYYRNLKTSSKAWQASATGAAKQYNKKLETVFDLALEELPSKARELINMLAFLNPDKIPEEMFIKSLKQSTLASFSSEADLIDVFGILGRRQLVRRDATVSSPYISIHRTVQWSVILNLSKDFAARKRAFEQTFELVRYCLPEVSSTDQPEPNAWAHFEKYVPQILNLRSHCLWPEPPVELPIGFAQVLSDMATYMWHAGLFKDGEEALETAEHILDDNNVGREHPLRGRIHEHLGIIASFSGVSERDAVVERRILALEARTASHDTIPAGRLTRDDNIRRYNVESDLAFGYLQYEYFDEAEEKMEMCLNKYKSWGSEEEIPFEYLKYNHIISYVKMAQGKPVEAVQHAKKGAALGELCAGLMHPMTWLVRFTLSHHLFLAQAKEECEAEIRSVLSARAKICGEFNRFTLEACAFCASVLAERGKHEEAETMYLRCLDPRKRNVWNREGIARTEFLYARTLTALAVELEDQLKRTTDLTKAQMDEKKMTVEKQRQEAERLLSKARATKLIFLEKHPKWLKDDEDELVVFDQMCCMWAGRYTGKLKAGADKAATQTSPGSREEESEEEEAASFVSLEIR